MPAKACFCKGVQDNGVRDDIYVPKRTTKDRIMAVPRSRLAIAGSGKLRTQPVQSKEGRHYTLLLHRQN
jgi:hypothetical protein